MTFAKCKDYEPGETFPVLIETEEGGAENIQVDMDCDNRVYECWQPNCIEDSEYNLVIIVDGMPRLARGCHFDFIEELGVTTDD
jgi:hypothetical protein